MKIFWHTYTIEYLKKPILSFNLCIKSYYFYAFYNKFNKCILLKSRIYCYMFKKYNERTSNYLKL